MPESRILQGNQDSASAWDEAVAYYVGSLEGTDGKGDGVLLYDLADKQCINFRTCGEYFQFARLVHRRLIFR
jgi:hypothetical protein